MLKDLQCGDGVCVSLLDDVCDGNSTCPNGFDEKDCYGKTKITFHAFLVCKTFLLFNNVSSAHRAFNFCHGIVGDLCVSRKAPQLIDLSIVSLKV